MITPLRRRHRWLAPTAFLAAIAGLAVAVNARPDGFVDRSGGSWVGAGDVGRSGHVLEEDRGRFAVSWASRTAQDGEPGGWQLRLLPNEPLDAPDLLIYAFEGVDPGGDVPEGARFLGQADPVNPTELTLAPGDDPSTWLAEGARTTCVPGLVPNDFRRTNRPTFQQVIEFAPERPER